MDMQASKAETTASQPLASQAGIERATPYAYYALFLLIVANLFNYLDRNIVSVLTPSIQKELHLNDADMGFLLGTAFAVLYGVLGIPMGRISDALSRTRLMAGGLALWSAMTAASGAATNFLGLASARVGVGVGEATASPSSHSLLCDYFPARNRAAVLGGYLASVHIGTALALVTGGLLIQKWSTWCASFPGNACTLAPWRAGFLIVGIPGIFLAVMVALLREPARASGTVSISVRELIVRELSSAIPPFTLFSLGRLAGRRSVYANLIFAGVLGLASVLLAKATGDWPQWIAVAIGVYSVATWAQVLKHLDPALYSVTFGCRTFMYTVFGGAFLTCFVGTIAVWAAPYAMRTLPGTPGKIGIAMGGAQLGAAGISVILGGYLTDVWKRHDRRAPVWIALISLIVPIPLLFVLLRATTLGGFIATFCVLTLFSMAWAGSFAALAQDLVLVRMRGAAAAIFALIIALTASGIGPYWTGKISTMTGSLTMGLYSLLSFVPAAFVLLLMAAHRLREETPARRQALARAAGEAI